MELPLYAMLLWIGAYDCARGRIPNSYLLLFGLMITAYWFHTPTDASLETALAGLGMGLVVGFVLYLTGLFAAGDAKLFAVLGAWLGPFDLLQVVAWSLILSGGIAAIYLLVHNELWKLFRRWWICFITRSYFTGTDEQYTRARIPMGGAIALATYFFQFNHY